jgi:hypothetical protein
MDFWVTSGVVSAEWVKPTTTIAVTAAAAAAAVDDDDDDGDNAVSV